MVIHLILVYISGDDFEDYEVCETLFYFSQKLILDLNATDECCLVNISDCHNGTDSPAQTVDRAKGKLSLLLFWLLHHIFLIN